jgi:hypothetical protein
LHALVPFNVIYILSPQIYKPQSPFSPRFVTELNVPCLALDLACYLLHWNSNESGYCVDFSAFFNHTSTFKILLYWERGVCFNTWLYRSRQDLLINILIQVFLILSDKHYLYASILVLLIIR